MAESTQSAAGAFRWHDIAGIAASGGFAGGGLLILVSAGYRWLGLEPLVWQQGFWVEFLSFAVAIVPLYLLTAIGLFLSRRAAIDLPAARWWLTAGLVMWGINFAITSFFHLPLNIYLAFEPFTPEQADLWRTLWIALHVPRVFLAIGTHLAAVLGVVLAAGMTANGQPAKDGQP